MPQTPSFGETAGSVYAELIEQQLDRQGERKASLEGRGMAVIGSSGTLVGLLFALAAVVTGTEEFSLSAASRALLVVALGAFLVASVLGIAVNWIREYESVLTSELERLLEPRLWTGRATVASRRVGEAKVVILKRAREHNDRKATLLRLAMLAEVAAIAVVATAVLLILLEA